MLQQNKIKKANEISNNEPFATTDDLIHTKCTSNHKNK